MKGEMFHKTIVTKLKWIYTFLEILMDIKKKLVIFEIEEKEEMKIMK